MIASKRINAVIAVLMAVAVVFTAVLTVSPEALGISATATSGALTYPEKLFAENSIMSLNIIVDEEDWQNMLDHAVNEEYISCDVIINGAAFTSVGIRPKGNTSLTSIASDLTTDRYSFKLEFDHYVSGQTCFGLDKLVINNMQSDATYLKEYLSYQLMDFIGVTAPLYVFSEVRVNGEYWGFYLAIEALEESFALRNYGSGYGELYKPETVEMGGSPGRDDEKESLPNANNKEDIPKNNFGGSTDGQIPGFPGGNGGTPPQIDGKDGQVPPFFPGNSGEGTNNGQPPPNASNNRGDGSGDETQTGGAADGQTPEPPGGIEPEAGSPPDGTTFQVGGIPGLGSSGRADLKYIDNNSDSYSQIFGNSVFDTSEQDYQRVIEALKNLNDGTDLEEYVNVDQVLRYFAANTVLVNLDSYVSNLKHNYYLYEKDGQISILPWDFNLSFAGFQSGSASSAVNFPIDTPLSGVELSERPLLGKLLEVKEYKERYHQYLQQIVTGYFDSGLYNSAIDSLTALISSYVQSDPSAFYTYEEFQASLPVLKQFGELRAKSIQRQLDGAIPATTDGQSKDPSSLIDASELDLTVLGSQGGGMPGGFGNKNNGDFSGEEFGSAFPQAPGITNPSGQGATNGSKENDGSTASPGFGLSNLPDQKVMRQAMQIIGDSRELTDKQLVQLAELGLTQDQISALQQIAQGGLGGGQNTGLGGGRPGDVQAVARPEAATVDPDQWILWGLCAAGLILGFAFVIWFPRRKLCRGK